jgi:1,2-diacylglycerol 3-alpha-glucosyltransferase
MRIAIFTDSFIPQVNGVVTATINLAKGLADRGNKVYIIAPKYRKVKEFSYPNVRVKRVFSLPAFFYEDFRFTSFLSKSLVNYIRKEKIEMLHFQTPVTLGIQAIMVSRALGLPLVGTFHTFFTDSQYLKHIGLNSKIIQHLAWFYAKTCYNKCDLITCPSETTRKELLMHKIKKTVKVISNGIDTSIFDNSKCRSVRQNYNPEGKLLLFVGRVAHEKNILYLIDCFNLVLKKMPATKLLIVGDGPQRKDVRRKIKELGIQNNVIMLGRIEHKDLVKSSLFGACDLFVTASVTENQPMTVLEAQANGLVCVGINKRGMKDLVKNGFNGYLAETNKKGQFANAVARLLSDEKLHGRMKNNTLKGIKRHELSHVIKNWEREYSLLIKNMRNN